MFLKNKLPSFFFEKKAQISAEMIIVMAALIGIAIVLVTKLQKSSKKAASAVDNKSDKLINQINNFDSDVVKDTN